MLQHWMTLNVIEHSCGNRDNLYTFQPWRSSAVSKHYLLSLLLLACSVPSKFTCKKAAITPITPLVNKKTIIVSIFLTLYRFVLQPFTSVPYQPRCRAWAQESKRKSVTNDLHDTELFVLGYLDLGLSPYKIDILTLPIATVIPSSMCTSVDASYKYRSSSHLNGASLQFPLMTFAVERHADYSYWSTLTLTL